MDGRGGDRASCSRSGPTASTGSPDRLGIASPPNALFLLGLVAVFGLLLNFSVAISRLSEETKILAQTVSRLDAEVRALRGEGPAATATATARRRRGARRRTAIAGEDAE